MTENSLTEYKPLKTFTIEDCNYDLHSRGICSCCGQRLFEVWRWAGAIFSRYILHNNFDIDQFENYVQELDREFLESSAELLGDFHHELCKINSKDGIQADGSYAFRLAEYGRQRAIALQALGSFDLLLSREKPNDDHGKAVMAAFELERSPINPYHIHRL